MALKPLISLNCGHEKRRPWTSFFVPGTFELVCNDLVIIGLGVGVSLKAYTEAYMLLVAVPYQAGKMTSDEYS